MAQPGTSEELPVALTREAWEGMMRAAMSEEVWESGYLQVPREALRTFFHAGDVPDEVLRAENALATVLPKEGGFAAAMPEVLGPVTGEIEVPVFLTYADADTSPDPAAEVAGFSRSRDVTLFRLAGSAHCHNAATTRHVLWQRLLAWVAAP